MSRVWVDCFEWVFILATYTVHLNVTEKVSNCHHYEHHFDTFVEFAQWNILVIYTALHTTRTFSSMIKLFSQIFARFLPLFRHSFVKRTNSDEWWVVHLSHLSENLTKNDNLIFFTTLIPWIHPALLCAMLQSNSQCFLPIWAILCTQIYIQLGTIFANAINLFSMSPFHSMRREIGIHWCAHLSLYTVRGVI